MKEAEADNHVAEETAKGTQKAAGGESKEPSEVQMTEAGTGASHQKGKDGDIVIHDNNDQGSSKDASGSGNHTNEKAQDDGGSSQKPKIDQDKLVGVWGLCLLQFWSLFFARFALSARLSLRPYR